MIKVTQEFETEGEAIRALQFNKQWSSLYEMDEWLRSQIKHGTDLTESEEDLLDVVRVRLNQIMENNGVDLLEIM
jgi:hypothetical protein